MVEGPKVSNILGKPEDLNNSEKLNSAPDQPCESSSDLSSLGVLPDNIRDDKMTQVAFCLIIGRLWLSETH